MAAAETYGTLLARTNGLKGAGFTAWCFLPGMGFGATEQWWGRGGIRPASHEGVDFRLYLDANGKERELPARALVPAAAAGRVVRIQPDFLGHTIWLRHAPTDPDGWRHHTAYGHVVPVPELVVGSTVAAGEIIARVAGPPPRPAAVPPHLHFTVARLAPALSADHLSWANAHQSAIMQLIDPQAFFSD